MSRRSMDESSSDFVTVVEVDERKNSDDFVTVVHIVPQDDPPASPVTEDVQIFRVPGERLGMALKFEGGACASQPIDRVFIQNINKHSPASRARGKVLGALQEGDELLRIQGRQVTGMSRINVVSCLRDERSSHHRDIPLSVSLTVRRVRDAKTHAKSFSTSNGKESHVVPELIANPMNGKKGPPPPIPPRLSSTTLSTVATKHAEQEKPASNSKIASNLSNGEVGKVNGKAVSKKSPPPLPPRRPKEPPPAAPISRKSQHNCKSLVTSDTSLPKRAPSPSASPVPAEVCQTQLPSSNSPAVVPEIYTDTFSDKSVSLLHKQDTVTYQIVFKHNRFVWNQSRMTLAAQFRRLSNVFQDAARVLPVPVYQTLWLPTITMLSILTMFWSHLNNWSVSLIRKKHFRSL